MYLITNGRGVARGAWVIFWLVLVLGSEGRGDGMITDEQAVEIARQELSEHGFDASEYTVNVEPHGDDDMKWMVWFESKGPFPVPGGTHGVRVDKGTGEAVFLPGE